MTKSNQRKSEILGMPFGTACYRLRQNVMFDLLRRHRQNVCFKCAKPILKVEDLTLEHKKAWQNVGPLLFWDLKNIAFSHPQCNLRVGVVKREIVNGRLWCPNCKQFKTIAYFHTDRKQRTGYAYVCKDCLNSKRKSIKATGDCNNCGAVRGTRVFRRSHNICISCHHELSRARTAVKRQQMSPSAK